MENNIILMPPTLIAAANARHGLVLNPVTYVERNLADSCCIECGCVHTESRLSWPPGAFLHVVTVSACPG